MAYEFKLPDLGEGVAEGEIVRWLVGDGDAVHADQPIVEVMTDKVTVELQAPVNGVIRSRGGEPGDVLPVGAVLVTIDTADGVSPAATAAPAVAPPAAPEAPPAKPATKSTGAVIALPAVRQLAKDLGITLEGLAGTGSDGRITEADVRAATTGASSTTAAPVEASPAVRRVPLRGMRRAIAEHLLDAQRNTAPYTYVDEVDFTELVRLRERLGALTDRPAIRLTFLPFILAALSMALREHPELNATVDAESGDLLVHSGQHIGVAVHTADGLVVPVVRSVEKRNLLDLSAEIERLSEAARGGRLSRDDVQGGTFSVTSLGSLGGLLGTPMLNTPEVAVMGVHRISERAVVVDGAVVARHVGNLSLTLDHRYIDGYVGAQFARTLVKYLEDPAMMLFWLAELRDRH